MHFFRLALVCAGIVLTGCEPQSKPVVSKPAAETPTPKAPKVEPEPSVGENGIEPTVKSLAATGAGEFEIVYEWRVAKKLELDWRVFVHFTDLEGQTRFQNDHDPVPATSAWDKGKIQQGPFKVKIPDGLDGEVQIRMGLYAQDKPGEGSRGRRELDGKSDDEKRVFVGRLRIGDATLELLPVD